MKLSEYLNTDLLRAHIESGMVIRTAHPEFPVVSYHYSKECQCAGLWDEVTTRCRGLIVRTDTWEIIARPYEKFFNMEELVDMGRVSEIPTNLPYTISEKVDGSLGILWWWYGVPYIATKGSFQSEQAQHATKWFREHYRGAYVAFNQNLTYLFEIIYPEDHHCVSYGDLDALVLHGLININTGKEISVVGEAADMGYRWGIVVPVVNDYSIYKWEHIRENVADTNREGFVVTFSNGFKMKLKYESYWRIHYLRSGLTDRRLLDVLSNPDPKVRDEFDTNINTVLDEENRIMVRARIDRFMGIFNEIMDDVVREYRVFPMVMGNHGYPTVSPEAASYYKTTKYPWLEFALAKGQDIPGKIWEYIRKTFKGTDNDNDI